MSTAELEALAPSFDFKRYFADRHAPSFDSLNVSVPDFFKNLNTLIDSTQPGRSEKLPHLALREHYSPPS